MNNFKFKLEIMHFLVSSNEYQNLKEIQEYLEEKTGEIINVRTIKKYLSDLERDLDVEFVNKQGRYGGYMISKLSKEIFLRNSLDIFSPREKDSIYSAFAIAAKDPEFSSKEKNMEIIFKYGKDFDFKHSDYEYKVEKHWHKNKNYYTNLNRIREALIKERVIFINTKYPEDNNKILHKKVTPLFLIRWANETLMICKNKQRKIKKISLNNIEDVEILSEKAIRLNTPEEIDYKYYLNAKKTDLKVKNVYSIVLEILNNEGWKFYALKYHEHTEEWEDGKRIMVSFNTIERAVQFYLIIKMHSKIIKISPEIIQFIDEKIMPTINS